MPLSFDDMHRKFYEFAQTVYGLRKLSALGPEINVLLVQGQRQGGRPRGARQPRQVRPPFPYRAERLSFRRIDGR